MNRRPDTASIVANGQNNASKPSKEWTGKKTLITISVFFGVIFIVNIFMVTVGVKSFPGEDDKQSYRMGIDFNQTLAQRNLQIASGWTADIDLTNKNSVVLKISDKSGMTMRGLEVTGILKHLAETDKDFVLEFAHAADGSYIAPIGAGRYGQQWLMLTSAKKADGTKFNTRNKIWLK